MELLVARLPRRTAEYSATFGAGRMAQQEATPAHIAPADKISREQQPSAQDFQQHINVWRTASEYFVENTGLYAFLEGFASGFFQDPSLMGDSAQNAAIAAQNINATYEQLVTIAAAHSARVPNSVINK